MKDKKIFKKSSEELQEYLAFRRRGSRVKPRKGKGSFKRRPKYKIWQGSSEEERQPVKLDVEIS